MDIDIDFQPTFDPTSVFPQSVPASMVRDGVLVKHPCGYYLQHIPVDQVTGCAAIPYKSAAEEEYFKIDFLHLSVLEYFESKHEIRTLVKAEPDWDILLNANEVAKLFQISKHTSVLAQVRPRSIQELADVIALIRPDKRHLLRDYVRDKIKVRPSLYRQGNDDKSSFKRSHSVAYAMTIVLQLHLIKAGVL